MNEVARTSKTMDCCPPGLTKDQKTDVLVRLEQIHEKMHAGKAYGFEQTLLCDAVREIKELRSRCSEPEKKT